jgi:hypothetical protein
MAQICQYIITSATGTKTRRLPRKAISKANWNVQRFGGYADLTIETVLPFALAVAATDSVQIGDRVEVFFAGSRRYRGYVTGLLPSETEPKTLTVQAYGLSQQAGKLPVDRRFAFPGNGYDIATAFSLVVNTVALNTAADGGLPTLTRVAASPIGTTISTLDGENKSFSDVMNDLMTAAGNLATWGIGVGPDGEDQAYINALDLTGVDSVFQVPGKLTESASSEIQTADIINVVKVTGGNAVYPNLLHNGSFELPVVQADNEGNWINNGSFEDGATAVSGSVYQWSVDGNPSIQTNSAPSNNIARAYDGNNFAQMDYQGYHIYQTKSGLNWTIGDPFLFCFYAARQYNGNELTTHCLFEIKDASGAVLTTQTIPIVNPSPGYTYYEFPFVMPVGADGFYVYFDGPDTGTSNGTQGLIVDAVQLYDTALVYQDGWTTQTNGNPHLTAINWVHSGVPGVDSFDGAYSVLLGMTMNNESSDSDNVGLLPPRQNPVSCNANHNYLMSARVKLLSAASGATIQAKMCYYWWGDNSNVSYGEQIGPPTALTVGDWTYISWVTQNQQGDAVNSLLPVVRVYGGDCTVLIDAVMLQDDGVTNSTQFPAGGTNPYVDDGPLTYFIRSDDPGLNQFHGGAAPPYAGSIATYGLRFAPLSADTVLDVPSAYQLADAEFQTTALPYYRPTITRLNDSAVYQCGKTFRLDGRDGSGLCDIPVQIARIREVDDGILHTTLEGQREQPDLQVTIRAIILKVLAQNGAGASGASGGGNGYSDGSNLNPTGVPSQPNSNQVALSSADTAPGYLDTKMTATAPLTATDTAGARVLAMPAATDAVSGYLTATDHVSLTAAEATTTEVVSARTPATGSAYANLKARLDAMTAAETGGGPPSGSAGGDLTGAYPNPTLAGIITGGSAGDATHTLALTYDSKGRLTGVTATAITFPVTSVAGRTGVITLSSTDISGLGTAAVVNVPSSGNATSTQAVLGSDTRVTGALLKRRIVVVMKAGSAADTAPDPNNVFVLPHGTGNAATTWKVVNATLDVRTPNASATTVQLYFSSGGNAAYGTGTAALSSALSVSGASSYQASTTSFVSGSQSLPTGYELAREFSALGGSGVTLFVELEES